MEPLQRNLCDNVSVMEPLQRRDSCCDAKAKLPLQGNGSCAVALGSLCEGATAEESERGCLSHGAIAEEYLRQCLSHVIVVCVSCASTNQTNTHNLGLIF